MQTCIVVVVVVDFCDFIPLWIWWTHYRFISLHSVVHSFTCIVSNLLTFSSTHTYILCAVAACIAYIHRVYFYIHIWCTRNRMHIHSISISVSICMVCNVCVATRITSGIFREMCVWELKQKRYHHILGYFWAFCAAFDAVCILNSYTHGVVCMCMCSSVRVAIAIAYARFSFSSTNR